MGQLEYLLQTIPRWASCAQKETDKAIISVAVPRAGGTASRKYSLMLQTMGSSVVVKETDHTKLLPTFCPDRHINLNGTFCLGLRAGHLVQDEESAHQWWDKLQVFLACQETAHETGAWPEYAQLSHGSDAAEIQIQAEDLAHGLGMLEELKSAMWRNKGAIAFAAKRVDVALRRPLNGRATCLCGRTDRRGRPLLRRQCWQANLNCLAVLERQRQDAVVEFWASVNKVLCCGTMDMCPLKQKKSSKIQAAVVQNSISRI